MRSSVLAFFTAAILAGCASTNPGVPDTQDDIPVPQGFTRAPDDTETKSMWEKQDNFRIYRVSYDGKAKAGDTTAFYKEQMPKNGWTLETANVDAKGGGAMLSYLKDSERCKIETKQKADDETTRVTVDIRYSK
ncbi:MAG: hypothetical protein AAB074_11055 [Planctomycetota bacterium]